MLAPVPVLLVEYFPATRFGLLRHALFKLLDHRQLLKADGKTELLFAITHFRDWIIGAGRAWRTRARKRARSLVRSVMRCGHPRFPASTSLPNGAA